MQSYELAAQLAQFSTVAQLSQANTALSNIQSYQAAINNAEMASLVGKNVTATQSAITVTSGSASTLTYQLGAAQKDVTVSIKDSNGDVIYTEDRGAQAAGNYSIAWNGKDSNGKTVADGTYTCSVQAVDSSGNASTVASTVQGIVYSLNLDSTSPYYILSGPNGAQVPAANVIQVETSSS
jgi:flagellar basal-body rod modification protein FlgD